MRAGATALGRRVSTASFAGASRVGGVARGRVARGARASFRSTSLGQVLESRGAATRRVEDFVATPTRDDGR